MRLEEKLTALRREHKMTQAELAEALVEKVREEAADVAIRRTMLSPIIGAHTGPGMLSMILIGK